MTSRLWGGRRADAFQDAVDGHVELSDRELTEFVNLARELRDAPAVQMSADVRASMRARLVDEAHSVLAPAPQPARTRPRRHRGLRVAVGTAVVVAGTSGGVASVSANSLPGDMLYPVKLGVERIQLGLDGGTAESGRTRLEHASNRLDEAERLARGGEADRVGPALGDFSEDADAGADQLLRAFASDADASSITAIRTFTHSAAGRLATIAGTIDEMSTPEYAEAVDTVNALDKRAVATCPDCTVEPPVDVPYEVGPAGNGDETVSLPPVMLPGLDDRSGDDVGPGSLPDDVLTEPQRIPRGTDLPPTEFDEPDRDQNSPSPDNPLLSPHNSNKNQSAPKQNKQNRPDDNDDRLPDLPELPELGGPDGKPRPSPLQGILRPVEDLLPQLDGQRPLDGLLGRLLGGDDRAGPHNQGALRHLLRTLLGPNQQNGNDPRGTLGDLLGEDDEPKNRNDSGGTLGGLLGKDDEPKSKDDSGKVQEGLLGDGDEPESQPEGSDDSDQQQPPEEDGLLTPQQEQEEKSEPEDQQGDLDPLQGTEDGSSDQEDGNDDGSLLNDGL